MEGSSLAGKAALVTGASRGIGYEIALGLAAAGAKVAVLARSASDLNSLAAKIREGGGVATAVVCDVTDADAIRASVDRALTELGQIDILVNNAGGPIFNAPFLDVRPDGWRRVLDLNLMSVVHFCHAVGARMVEQRSGSVINIDSIGAAHPAAMVAPYCAAKAAVVNLTMLLAQEWGPSGVRVNSLSPGWIRTEINRKVAQHVDLADSVARRIPLRRWGEPADIVGAAIWLASDASAYVSGAHIPIDGGIGVVAPQAPGGPSG
jgi:gluconate 5-dehydrogenase